MGSTRTTTNNMKKIHPLMLNHIDHDGPPCNNMNLSLGCKRLRPLAPRLAGEPINLDLKSFIIQSPSRSISSSCSQLVQGVGVGVGVGVGGGGTSRWNPTQEQIGILEMLYRGGMRTPNAQQIEHITLQLGKYGKIEGKNVFYWFQNHKARERQKQKRIATSSTTRAPELDLDQQQEEEGFDACTTPYKMRKCSAWAFHDQIMNKNVARRIITTLDLFPLHPEGSRS